MNSPKIALNSPTHLHPLLFAHHPVRVLFKELLPLAWEPSTCGRVSHCQLAFKGFPALLRKNGYFTTNNVKTDYNSGNYQQIIEASWNESSATARGEKDPIKKYPSFRCSI